MKIKYRVLSIEEDKHSMVVRYWTDKITEEMLATEFEPNGKIRKTKYGYPVRCTTDYNLTFYDNLYPTDEEVDYFIKRNAPSAWLKVREEALEPGIKTDLGSVKKILNKEFDFEVND